MALLTELRHNQSLMYPKISLINKSKSNLIVFERDFNNPLNEGFIIYWEITKSNKQLIFKKRITTTRAKNKLIKLQKEGWVKVNLIDRVA